MKTQRLLLNVVKQNDIKHIYEGLSHPKVIKYYGVSYRTMEETQEQMVWYKDLLTSQKGIWWSIREQESDNFVGAGGFNDWSKDHNKAEVGFWLLPDFWGKGYMQEAMKEILSHGFHQMNLNRIEGFVESENNNCKKAIEKLGFNLEGTMKEVENRGDQYIDVDIYSMLKDDWEKRYKNC